MGERFFADIKGRHHHFTTTIRYTGPANVVLFEFPFKARLKSLTFRPRQAINASATGRITIDAKKNNTGSTLGSQMTLNSSQTALALQTYSTTLDTRFADGDYLSVSLDMLSGYPEFPEATWEVEYEPDYDQS